MPATDDIEMSASRNIEPTPLGFAAVVSLMASDRDQDLLIFRKFGRISARNLLYLQCELLAIEDQLRKWDKKIACCRDIDLEEVAETWEVMIKEAKQGKTEATEMMGLIDEALDLESRITRLHLPDERVIRVAQNELWGGPLESDGQKRRPMVNGLAKNYLDAEEDLVSLKAAVETDPLSKALRARWPGKEETSRDGVSRISRANERSVTTAVTVVNIIAAIILLVGPITSLSFVSSRPAVLGMIGSFTVMFAMSVGLMTNAKRAEIFAGSAA
ncbi:uncharacterized protein NECHADRAFT_80821 [Fusarium vanettenii 77-13-4]|uniref:DUF6594 domain-containing protein n=1 Tax=Fusarium vanettenii (strain ATCC MYA-4622 / CBS 123669 / FGSC 9596 / NRRL 45880 / 77-13-4) TaxID=660122 RepID=C7YSR1_FUSV7|nr:uncharacterized protein NECHADRAFT_80821 [Fusarium vanettenii 77-13-4]EEU45286.1 hypothetical protein NECHADRAFT_80821 [Fusarium vanettenii 77-13-4]